MDRRLLIIISAVVRTIYFYACIAYESVKFMIAKTDAGVNLVFNTLDLVWCFLETRPLLLQVGVVRLFLEIRIDLNLVLFIFVDYNRFVLFHFCNKLQILDTLSGLSSLGCESKVSIFSLEWRLGSFYKTGGCLGEIIFFSWLVLSWGISDEAFYFVTNWRGSPRIHVSQRKIS